MRDVALREALRRLAVEGFVELSTNQAATVSQLDLGDMRHAWTARLTLEPAASAPPRGWTSSDPEPRRRRLHSGRKRGSLDDGSSTSASAPSRPLTVSSDDLNPSPKTAPRDPEEVEARAAGRPPEISPATTLGPVHLTVADLDRSVGYYDAAVGLETLERADGRATLGVAAGRLLVLIEEPGARPAAGYTGLYHFALLVPERVDLARWLAHAARDRVALTGLSDHFVSEAIYLTDPDGHGIEIYQDRPREAWEGLVASRMTTLPLDVDALFGELADPASEPFEGLPAGTVMGHVHLKVAQIADTIGFYRDVLGFGVMAQLGGQAAFLSAGGYHHHIGANTWESQGAPPAPEGFAALRHGTIVLPTADERERLLGRAAAAGAGAEETAEGPLLTDPSGNKLLVAVA